MTSPPRTGPGTPAEPDAGRSPAALSRRQHTMDELGGATARALAGEPRLRLRAGRPYLLDDRVPDVAAHLRPDPGRAALVDFRGAADGHAIRLRHSDLRQHARSRAALVPEGSMAPPVAAVVFDLLEQYRAESLADLPGVRHNLAGRHAAWTDDFLRSGAVETQAGLLLFTVAQVTRARVVRTRLPERVEDIIEATRFALAPTLGGALRELRVLRHDQGAYAVPATAIARHVAGLLDTADGDDADTQRAALAALVLPTDADDEVPPPARSGRSHTLTDDGGRYRVFTRDYDRVTPATTLVRPEELAELRDRLDRVVAAERVNVRRLARRLLAALARPVPRGRLDGQEEGLLDGRRLARLVSSPTERRVFWTGHDEPVADAAVTLLVDCSGSMRGHQEQVAVLVDVLGRALHLAGVTIEVLGFSTGGWNGGRAARDWQRAGRPAGPGRVAEALHLVFKPADVPWGRGRAGVAALLKGDLFREGLDGEALTWATDRIEGRPERTRLVVVVSDGSPRESATGLANDEHYLEHHLRDVVAARDTGSTRVLGLGVGLDLGPYYRTSLAVDLASTTTAALADEVVTWLSESATSRGPGRVPVSRRGPA